MTTEEKLQQLKIEINPYFSKIEEAGKVILDQEVSKYPIFVVHKEIIDIGVPIIKKNDTSLWSINASTLEEFAIKKIVDMDKVKNFQSAYKDPEKFFCFFVLNDLGSNFVFIPIEK